MDFRTLADVVVSHKTVLLRADFNVPLHEGKVQDETRLRESLPTIEYLIQHSAKVVIVTHLGRPKGQVLEEFRLNSVADCLSELLGKTVKKTSDCVGPEVKSALAHMEDGEVLLLENVRFHKEEEVNDSEFAKTLAEGCDFFVNDAFASIHRAHASTVGVTVFLPSYAGFLVEKEVRILSGILEHPEKPVILVAGGAKIDTKIGILEKFLKIADTFIIGGALANTFLAAEGHEIGKSLCEVDKIATAQRFLQAAQGKQVLLPMDAVVAADVTEGLPFREVLISEVLKGEKILDIGSQTIALFTSALKDSKTVLWNGPMGFYERAAFEKGTRSIAECIAGLFGVKVLGGGDSIDAVNHFGIPHEKFTHISTGGGAMLEFLEGKLLPGLAPLLKEKKE